jgi:hypothetical protein
MTPIRRSPMLCGSSKMFARPVEQNSTARTRPRLLRHAGIALDPQSPLKPLSCASVSWTLFPVETAVPRFQLTCLLRCNWFLRIGSLSKAAALICRPMPRSPSVSRDPARTSTSFAQCRRWSGAARAARSCVGCGLASSARGSRALLGGFPGGSTGAIQKLPGLRTVPSSSSARLVARQPI